MTRIYKTGNDELDTRLRSFSKMDRFIKSGAVQRKVNPAALWVEEKMQNNADWQSMTPYGIMDCLEALGLYDVDRVAALLSIDTRTVRGYITGRINVPTRVVVFLRMLQNAV